MPSLITPYPHSRLWSTATLISPRYNYLLCVCPLHQTVKPPEQGLASISSFSPQNLVKARPNQTFKFLINRLINCSIRCWWATHIPSLLIIPIVKVNKQKSHLKMEFRSYKRESSCTCHSTDTTDPIRDRSTLHLGQKEISFYYLSKRKKRFLLAQ